MATKKPTAQKKKAPPKKEKRDLSQVAFSIMQQVTADQPTARKSPKR